MSAHHHPQYLMFLKDHISLQQSRAVKMLEDATKAAEHDIGTPPRTFAVRRKRFYQVLFRIDRREGRSCLGFFYRRHIRKYRDVLWQIRHNFIGRKSA